MKQDCKTKYPILLAHGLAAPDSGVRHPPWGRVPQLLRDRGAVVYMGGQDAWGSIENGAARLEQVLYRMLQEQNCSRVNIIAHSKGGLEARYLISTLGHGRHVASLTMLSTPNRGSRVAEMLLYARPAVALWARGNDAFWARYGDACPDSLRAGEQLTPAYLARFNRENPDAACVYYQSWGARLGRAHTDGAMLLTRGLFYPAHGDSDGLVTPASARWGRWRGTLEGVSHRQIVDVPRRDTAAFSPPRFFVQLVRELAEMGF